jgi:hypothetical protein
MLFKRIHFINKLIAKFDKSITNFDGFNNFIKGKNRTKDK